MGWFSNIVSRLTGQTKAVDISPELWSVVNGGWGLPTKSGQQVSSYSSLQTTAFYRGILVIAEGIAQLPVEVYRRSGRGSEPAIDHPLYDVLLHRSNNLQDAFQFFRTTLMHAAAAGDGISYKVMVNGQVRELIPIRPECVSISLPDDFNMVTYDLTLESGRFATVSSDQVFHVSGPSWAAHRGLNPTVIGREAIGLSRSAEETQASFHRNGARPAGVLQSDQKLDKDDVARLRESWRQVMSGSAKAGETAVLGQGLKWQQIQMVGVDAGHLDTRKHQIEEIARLLGVFPMMLGHAGDQSPTFASAEAFLAAHVRYTLQPWIKALRSAAETQLLTKDERADGYHVRIDTSELLRGSLKDRADYYKAALGTTQQPGWLAPNEVREDDGWNPVEDDDFDKPMKPTSPSPATAPAATDGMPAEAKSSRPRTLYVSRKVVNGAEIIKWAKKQGFKSLMEPGDLHVTIAFSRKPLDWMAIPSDWMSDKYGRITIPPGGPRVVEKIGNQGAVALKFMHHSLDVRHREIREAGASWDWEEYQPHITLTYDATGVDLDKVVAFQGEFVLGPELFAEIDPNWRDNLEK